ncbi:MAG: class I SAM-dependent methyltransferase [Nitrospirae bacterium]|nr:class I SAM-dependent methyltransferase [Nitrospirota bacterium]
MDEELNNHGKITGKLWDGIHGGYFSNKDAAAPLVLTVLSRINPLSPPAAVADLGGGTGFILKEIAQQLNDPSIRLINIDMSGSQLSESRAGQILTIHCPIEAVKRETLLPQNGTLLFIMRSVLHYFGSGGIGGALSHIRQQMRPGECFIHQTACFETDSHAVLLNELFRITGLNKWFPSVNELNKILSANGFIQTLDKEVAALPVSSRDFAKRYDIDDKMLMEIGQKIKARYGEIPKVFETCGGEFTFYLHCRIFISEAV